MFSPFHSNPCRLSWNDLFSEILRRWSLCHIARWKLWIYVIFITPVALTDFIPKTEQAAAAALAVFAVLCRKIHFVDCMELLPASSACFIQTHSSVPAQNQLNKFSVFMNEWSQLWCLCSPLGVFSCFCVLLRERDILKQPRPLSATVSMSDWCKNGWRWDVVGS